MALNEIIKKSIEKAGLYWFIGPTYRQVKSIAWVRIKNLLQKSRDFWKFNEQELSVSSLLNGTRIELKGADNEDSLLGVGLDGVVMDECALQKQGVWDRVVRPMLVDKQGWALFISTPRGRNWFFDLFTTQDDNWQSWRHPTSINRFIPQSEIELAKGGMPARLFQQEFMAEFLDDETGVFRRIRQCICGELKEPVVGRYYVLGVDLARLVDWTVLTCIDSVTREVVAFNRFNQISWAEQKMFIQEMSRKYNNAVVFIDGTAVGDPIVEDLQTSYVPTEAIKFTNDQKDKLITQLAVAIEQRQITIPPDLQVVIDELKDYEYELTDNGRIKYSAPEGKHDDCVISLALAVWGIRTNLKEHQILRQQVDDIETDRIHRGQVVWKAGLIGDENENAYAETGY